MRLADRCERVGERAQKHVTRMTSCSAASKAGRRVRWKILRPLPTFNGSREPEVRRQDGSLPQ